MDFFGRFRKPSLSTEDHLIRENYLKQFQITPSGNTPLRKVTFKVVDTETTGLDPKRDQLLSIACIKVREFQIYVSKRFERMIHQPEYQPGDSVQVHGIMSRHSLSGQNEKEVLAGFLDFIKADVIVGHHITFDMRMLNMALQNHYHLNLRNKIIDTGQLSHRIENPMKINTRTESLDVLCKRFNIPLGDRHTASGDAFMTALLFLKLLGKLERRKVETYKSLFSKMR